MLRVDKLKVEYFLTSKLMTDRPFVSHLTLKAPRKKNASENVVC